MSKKCFSTSGQLWMCLLFSIILLIIYKVPWSSWRDSIIVNTDLPNPSQNGSKMNLRSNFKNQAKTYVKVDTSTYRKVVIGAVNCRAKIYSGWDYGNNSMLYGEKTVTMIKSVLLSAKLDHISNIDFYLFLERKEDADWFLDKLHKLIVPGQGPELQIFIRSAIELVPIKYRDHMIYHPKYRCGYTRFFFPTALPDVDALIYIDNDMLMTGSLWKMWTLFENFTKAEIVGIARCNEPNDTYYLKMDEKMFRGISYPPPRGINTGLVLMNLTRMREYKWEARMLRVYDNYSSQHVSLNDQRTVNILLADDLKSLKMLSCQYNFNHRHCDRGFTCWDAVQENDEESGIHLVHGNGYRMEKGGVFHEIYRIYEEFNMTVLRGLKNDHDELEKAVKEGVMQPIRKFYDDYSLFSKCYGTLNHVLYTKYFNATENATFKTLLLK